MHPQRLGGAGYIVPLAGLLLCLGGVAVAEMLGIPIVTMAWIGVPAVFALVILGWGVYKIDQYRTFGEREKRIRSYLKSEEYLDNDG